MGQKYVSYRNFARSLIIALYVPKNTPFQMSIDAAICEPFEVFVHSIANIPHFRYIEAPVQYRQSAGDAQAAKRFSHFARPDVQKPYAAFVIGDVHMVIVEPCAGGKPSTRLKQFILRRRCGSRWDGRSSRRDRRSGRRDGRSGRRDGRSGRRDGRSGRRDGRSGRRDGRSGRRDGRSGGRDGRSGRRDGRSGRRDGRSGRRDGRSGRRDGRSSGRNGRSGGRDGRSGRRDGRSGRRGRSGGRHGAGYRNVNFIPL